MTSPLPGKLYDIYELQDTVKLTIDEAISFLSPTYRPVLKKAMDNIINYSQPFDLELLFRTARNNRYGCVQRGWQ